MGEQGSDKKGAGEEDKDEDDDVECGGRGVVAGGRRRKGGRVGLEVRVRVLLLEATGFDEGMRGGGGHGGEGGERVDHV